MAATTSWVNLLTSLARQSSDRPAYTFLDSDGEELHLTYADLDLRARGIGGALQRILPEGARALLLYPPSLDFICAFLGCLYSAIVAVPSYLPRVHRGQDRLRSIARDAKPEVVLTTADIAARATAFQKEIPELAGISWIATDTGRDWTERGAVSWRDPHPDGDSLAFLQYTSGSTADPKGVMVSHRNLFHNEEAIRLAFGQSERSVIVGWLPLYHDMGLVGNVLQPLYVGARCVLMSPTSFLQSPRKWLEAISRYRGTTSGGPNFAYELCVAKIGEEQRAGLDLSSWEVAFNGAEPVRATTLERFAESFAPCGFRVEAFYPCYGLAEATLFVTGGHRGSRPSVDHVSSESLERDRVSAAVAGENARRIVSCGFTWEEQDVVVVDPQTHTLCAPKRVGEIWVCGPSVAQGYWNRSELTERDFRARLADRPEAGVFLRTGDLGYRRGGQLFPTGRLKDLIVIRGRNHYPQDIELTAERVHPALRPGCSAAFPVEVEGEERLVLVQEVERSTGFDPASVLWAVRAAVSEMHDLALYDLVLIRSGTIPKTSSGKIRRGAARDLYLDNRLLVLARERVEEAETQIIQIAEGELSRETLLSAAPEERCVLFESWLRHHTARLARVAPFRIEPELLLSQVGIDSLAAIELGQLLIDRLGVVVPIPDLLAGRFAELVERLLAELAREPIRVEPAAALELEMPLSYEQRALWFLHRLAPESPAYLIPVAARWASAIDTAALARTLVRLTERHAALRTSFHDVDGEPRQQLHEQAEICFRCEDASGWDAAELRRHLEEEAWRPFRLESAPLLRITLFSRGSNEHLLVATMHHLVCDFWSMGVLARDLGSLYAREIGNSAELPSLSRSHADHLRWQQALLNGTEGDRLWDYWRHQLAGLPDLDLPTDRPRPPVQTYYGAAEACALGGDLSTRLSRLVRSRGATLSMALLAVFQALLGRLTGQEDFAVGVPMVGRESSGLSEVVGYFVSPVVVRSDLSGRPGFALLLDRVRRAVLGAFAHQGFPLALLGERLQPERDASRPPLFQAMFVLQRPQRPEEGGLAAFALGVRGAPVQLGPMVLEPLDLEVRSAPFELVLRTAELDHGLSASLQYNRDLFDTVQVRRLLACFQSLLDGALADPEHPLSTLPLLSIAEQRQLLVEWNDTAVELETEILAHELVASQAAASPEAPALVERGEILTYGDLYSRASRLARHLNACNVVPDTPVGIFAERSSELVVAALAVLLAGGAYVPLDPSYPPERLRFIVESTGMPVLLVRSELPSGLLLPDRVRVVCIGAGVEAGGHSESPRWRVYPQNLAYVIHTSGSTGWPKGVQVTHSGLLNLILWHQRTYGVTAADRATLLAAPGFDASVWELWPYLAVGASLQVVEEAIRQSPADLIAWLAAERITFCFLPTPLAEAVLTMDIPEGAALRAILTGGDRLHQHPPAAWTASLINHYGPTELSVVATRGCVEPGADPDRTPGIGRAIANTRIYLFDREGQPALLGAPGEIWIGGAGLARGYCGRPDLTAERFVPDPFSIGSGERLYRTGDLARFTRAGDLEFCGRIDFQAKIRGYRIELGEIETRLLRHPGVRDAAVIVREAGPCGRELVAYVVFTNSGDVATPELRNFLLETLPAPMVPSRFVALPSLPLDRHGKVDRRALPEPAAEKKREDLQEPRVLVEELLAGIWCELLGVEQVGAADNFFELGGHSLLAAQLTARARKLFGVELPLVRVLETQTLRELARCIEEASGSGARALPPLVARRAAGENPPLSFAQERFWFLDQLEPGSPLYSIPGGLRLVGPLAVEAFRRALGEILRRHEVLRATFPASEGRPVQRLAPPVLPPLPVVDLQALSASARIVEARRLDREDYRLPFDLAAGPLLRARLLRLRADEHLLLLTLHHIAADGWSVQVVLLRELSAFYQAFARGQAPEWPDPPLQYADFAAWQRAALAGEILAAQLAVWRERLRRDLPVLMLPVDHPRPEKRTGRGGSQPLDLPVVPAGSQLARREGITPFMLLIAAFQTLLHRYSGENDLAVGAPVAHRDRIETEGLIGPFVNTLVLRGDLAGDPPFRELLVRTRCICLEAYSAREVPFEQVVEEVQPRRDLAATPLFQALLAFQSLPVPSLDLPRLVVSRVERERDTAKFDLTLNLEEAERQWRGSLGYASDLFDTATAARMAGHFRSLLEGIVAEPDRRLSELPILSEAERAELLREWNDTAEEPAPPGLFPALFEQRVRVAPGAVAVVAGVPETTVTYRSLDQWTNRLAHLLSSLGAMPEAAVAVCLDRSLEAVVAVVGILKTGAAYVPLHPGDPAERKAATLADIRPCAVVGRGELSSELAMLSPELRPPLVLLEPDNAALARQSPDPLPLDLAAEHPAYILYTSGSTGRPKGVIIGHGSLVGYLHWVNWALAGAPALELPFATPLVFDASLKQILAPLVRGDRIWAPGEDVLGASPVFAAALAARADIALNCVPLVWEALLRTVERGEAPAPAGLRKLLLGGDRIAEDLVSRTRALLPGIDIVNLYGPTEVTANAGSARLVAGERITIGRPLPGVRLLVLDPGLRPVPAGVAGELFVGGPGLARGYLGQPDLTAERFVPDLWSGTAGGRLYRTGDRALRLADGRVAFLGRLDHQIKIRGVRVELEEIEAVLRLHPHVLEAAVLLSQGERHRSGALTAFVTVSCDPEGPANAWARDLRDFVHRRLPEPMVPAMYVRLDEFPRLSSGKVDRQRLEAEAAGAIRVGEGSGVSPAASGVTLEIVAHLWSDVLGVERIEPEDDFFALGGHSLLASQVVSRLRHVFQVDLSLRALFEAPRAGSFARTIESLRTGAGEAAPILPVPRTMLLPLSSSQQRLWVLDRIEGGGTAYSLPAALRLEGGLNAAALERSLAALVGRHEILRTTFVESESQPLQVIHPPGSRSLPRVNLRGLADPEREASRLAGAEAGLGFDLGRGPLLRCTLLTLAADDHILLLNMHHIISDGWSIEVFLRELGTLYSAAVASRTPALPELALQFADYAVWQRQWLQSESARRRLASWQERLAGLPPLDLPTDHPRPLVQTFRGADEPVIVPAPLAERLAAWGRRSGTTLFMMLLAGFEAVLFRLSGQRDFGLGSPLANRGRLELEGLIGCFVNPMVFRAALDPDQPFQGHLATVRDAVLAALADQDTPFEELVAALRPERSLSRSPLFQVMFVLQSPRRLSLDLPGLWVTQLELEGRTARFDLTLSLRETDGEISGHFEYSTDLFDRPTVRRMAERLVCLLEAAEKDSACRLAELSLLSKSERHQLTVEWNDTGAARSASCLHQLWGEQADTAPDAVALVWNEGQAIGRCTYIELSRRVYQLAHHLRDLGVGPEVLVGVALNRSPELMVALLAVLATGGAYVPLDLAYPPERLAFILEDSKVAALITEKRLLAALEESALARVPHLVCLDVEGGTISARPTTPPWSGAQPSHLAYVLYTSGSTGRPKGTGISHAGVSALVEWSRQVFPAEDLAGVFASTSINFDVSVFELFVPLALGGTVILGDSVLDLPGHPAAQEVTLVSGVPSLVTELLERGVLPAGARTICLAGEPLPRELAVRLAFGPRRRVLNLYGPTEDTIYSTWADVTQCGRGAVPIGRPIAGSRAYLVDRELRPVPREAAGELCLAGAGLTRGYLGRPDLTAEKLIPDPFGGPGERLYRTGDLARFLADGRLEFRGRIDQQVKIRGVRIELGEVESALRRHPAIREVAVAVRGAGVGAQLVACVVARQEPLPSALELRRFLRETLPEPMIPADFVPWEALPLTPNGKLDRNWLREQLSALSRQREAYSPPRSALEVTLAELWGEVLRVDRVGIHDSFFALGGHSLSAIRLVSRMREALQVEIPVRRLFEAPTIAELCPDIIRIWLQQMGDRALTEVLNEIDSSDVLGQGPDFLQGAEPS